MTRNEAVNVLRTRLEQHGQFDAYAMGAIETLMNPRLYGAEEARKRFGLPYQQRGNITKLSGFPDPYVRLARGAIYMADDVDAAAERSGRKPVAV